MTPLSPEHHRDLSRELIALGIAVAWILGMGIFILGVGTAAAQNGPPTEYQVKAAFLYKFGEFVEWPTNAFAGPDDPLRIGVWASRRFEDDLVQVVQNKTINGHLVVVRRISTPAEARRCHIVFISAAAQNRLPDLRAALRGASVLTVTERAGNFYRTGIMINLLVENNRIRFEINNTAADQAGLKISAKLLALAESAKPARLQ